MKVQLRENPGRIEGSFSQVVGDRFEELLHPTGEPDGETMDRDIVMVYAGDFVATTGEIKVTGSKLSRLVSKHNAKLSALTANGAPPAWGDLPPIQVDHTQSGWDTVGRVIGPLRTGEVTLLGEEKPRAAVFTRGRFMGKDNCQRVRDGRWASVSFGGDFDEGRLDELTVTPFPAARQSHILSARLLSTSKLKGALMDIKVLLARLMKSNTQLSEKDAEEKLSKMSDEEKEKLAECDDKTSKMGEEKPCEKKEMSEEDEKKEKEKLAAEEDEKKKALAAKGEEETKKEDDKLAAPVAPSPDQLAAAEAAKTRLAAARTSVAKLSREMRTSFQDSSVKMRTAVISTRLSALRANAQITPAEIKKLNVKELASKSDDILEAFFMGFENRQPVVPLGQLGTQSAETISKMTGQVRRANLLAECVANMPFTGKAVAEQLGIKPKAYTRLSDAGPGKKPGDEKEAMGAVQNPGQEHLNSEFTRVCKMMDEGKRDEALSALRTYMEGMARDTNAGDEPGPQDSRAQMSALAESNKKLQNQFEELIKMVAPVLEFSDDDLKS